MAIINYPGYISKEKAAERYQVTVRTINIWIRHKNSPHKIFHAIKIDGVVCVNDVLPPTNPLPSIALNTLEWLPRFARRRKLNMERVYEDVMKDELDGVIIGGRVCVINNDEKTLKYISSYKRIRIEKLPGGGRRR